MYTDHTHITWYKFTYIIHICTSHAEMPLILRKFQMTSDVGAANLEIPVKEGKK